MREGPIINLTRQQVYFEKARSNVGSIVRERERGSARTSKSIDTADRDYDSCILRRDKHARAGDKDICDSERHVLRNTVLMSAASD